MLVVSALSRISRLQLGRKVANKLVFCSSLVKSELTWLRLEKLEFKANQSIRCIDADRATTRYVQMEIIIRTFSAVPGQLASLPGVSVQVYVDVDRTA